MFQKIEKQDWEKDSKYLILEEELNGGLSGNEPGC
jgi:hypothetical protein